MRRRMRQGKSGRGAFAVQIMFADVRLDARIEHGVDGFPMLEGVANFGRGGALGEIGQQVEMGCASGRVVQGEHIRSGALGGYALGQCGGEAVEIEAGARRDDHVAGEEEVGGAMPLADGEKGVRAHEEVNAVLAFERGAQGADGVQCVVGAVVGVRGIDQRYIEAGLALDGETGHRDTMAESGTRAVALERLHADGREQDAVEAEALHGEPRQGDVSAMRRIEAAAEEADLHLRLSIPRLNPVALMM